MPARRLLLIAAMLLLLSAALGSAGRTDPDRAVAPPPSQPSTPPPAVAGELPADRTVRASVGDLVTIEVRPREPEAVVIEDLGVDDEASPQLPGRLELVADRAGRFAIVGEVSRARLGTLVVTD